MSKIRPEPIHGFVRVRPDKDKSKHVVEVKGEKEIKLKQQHEKKYIFDRVFGPNTSQLEVYNGVVPPMITKVLQGYSCFVFAYGPAKTGKSYTLLGNSTEYAEQWNEDSEVGCIPRALGHILEEIKKQGVTEWTVRVSYLELYNEEMIDLLNEFNQNRPLRVLDDPEQKKTVFIENLTACTLSDAGDIGKILLKAFDNHAANTRVFSNYVEGESHRIFSITVYSRLTTLPGEEILKTGNLYFVEVGDPGYSANAEKPLQEAHTLHQSREALFEVINALAERRSYIPYKDSKLTRILQVGLGGHGKTSFIATVDPQFCYLTETTSTLEFLKGARRIINNVEVNKVTSKTNVVKCLDAEIESLQKDLHALRTGSGFYVDASNWSEMQKEEAKKKDRIAAMTEKISDREGTLEQLQNGKELKIEEWSYLNDRFRNLRVTALENKAHMVKTEKSFQHEKNISELYEKTLEAISNQNQELVDLVSGSVQHLTALEERHKFLLEKTTENDHIANEFFQKLQAKPDVILTHSSNSATQNTDLLKLFKADLDTAINFVNQYCKESLSKTERINLKIQELEYYAERETMVHPREEIRPFFEALHCLRIMLNTMHKSITNSLASVAQFDSTTFAQQLVVIQSLLHVNTTILFMAEQQDQTIKHLARVIKDCVRLSEESKKTDDALDKIFSDLQRLKEMSAEKKMKKERLRQECKEVLRIQKEHLREEAAKKQHFSDLVPVIHVMGAQTNICKTRYGKPVQTFEDVSDKMEAELFRINRDSQERIAEKTGNYSNDLITLDSDLKDIVKPLLADITNLSTSTTNEIVNISKRMLGKLSTGVQNIMEMENNMENLDAKMKASLNIVKGIAKNGVDHFKSVESAQETHDFPHAVLEEAAGISSYKVDEIENVKGRMKILTQSCKENVQKGPTNSSSSQ